jgi:hypothetical protein
MVDYYSLLEYNVVSIDKGLGEPYVITHLDGQILQEVRMEAR